MILYIYCWFFWPMETSVTNLGPSLLTISFNLVFWIFSFNSDCGFTSLLHTSPPPNVARFLEVPLIYGREHCSFPASKIAYYHKVLSTHMTLTLYSPVIVTLCTNNFNIIKLYFLHGVHLCVLYGPQNKQWLFPHRTLIDWFSQLGRNVCCTVGT